MARYALFQGVGHEAEGGWNDLEHIGTLDECKAKGFNDWAHIVDLDACKMVFGLKHHCERAVLTGHPDTWTKEWVPI
jgi:hypothetical protein